MPLIRYVHPPTPSPRVGAVPRFRTWPGAWTRLAVWCGCWWG